MPELPEIETVVRLIRPHVVGRAITGGPRPRHSSPTRRIADDNTID